MIGFLDGMGNWPRLFFSKLLLPHLQAMTRFMCRC